MGLLDRFTNMDETQTQGLLAAASQMLQQSGPSRTPQGFGQIVGGGMEAYQGATMEAKRRKMHEEEAAQMASMRALQMEGVQQQQLQSDSKRSAMDRLRTGYGADPKFQPNMADLLEVDPASYRTQMRPDSEQAGFGLQPKIGRNPSTGKTAYFIQDRSGNTKWLDAEVPGQYKHISGNEYRDPVVFDPRTGSVQATSGSPSPSMGGAPGGMGAPGSMGQLAPEQDMDAPWANLHSPREVDDMKKRVYELDSKRLAEMNEAVRSGRATLADLTRFGELNRKSGTGGVDDRLGLPTFNDDKQEMEAITSRLAPRQRAPGSGATSDFDAKMFLSALPSIAKDGPANMQIRAGYEKSISEATKEKDFYEQYFLQKGHLKGADTAFAKSLQKKDVAAPSKNSKNTPANWGQINANYAAGAGQRHTAQLEILQDELSRASSAADRETITGEIQREQAKAPKPAQSASVMAEMPKANASNKGRTIRDSDTGKRYRSNGIQWIQES